MKHQKCDFLIVGTGLAGSILAYMLKQAGKSVFIIDDPLIPSASRVAAGLINPVTGKRLVLQGHINTLLPFAVDFYQQLEKLFSIRLLTHKTMLRIISSEKECDIWSKRCENEAYGGFLGQKFDSSSIKSHFSSFIQHKTSFLDANTLLDVLQAWFKQHDCLIESDIKYDDIDVSDDGIFWQGIDATQMIFCEGWRGQNNPWFKDLPFQPAKGEILTLKSDTPLPDKILNWGRWMIPMQDGVFKLGATYDRDHLNETTTETAKKELIESLNSVLKQPVNPTMIEHKAGVRSATRDKSPFIGKHPKHASLAIFNGFGSKGSLLIPWFANQFLENLCYGKALPDSENIARFYEY